VQGHIGLQEPFSFVAAGELRYAQDAGRKSDATAAVTKKCNVDALAGPLLEGRLERKTDCIFL